MTWFDSLLFLWFLLDFWDWRSFEMAVDLLGDLVHRVQHDEREHEASCGTNPENETRSFFSLFNLANGSLTCELTSRPPSRQRCRTQPRRASSGSPCRRWLSRGCRRRLGGTRRRSSWRSRRGRSLIGSTTGAALPSASRRTWAPSSPRRRRTRRLPSTPFSSWKLKSFCLQIRFWQIFRFW